MTCHQCGSPNHLKKDCPQLAKAVTSAPGDPAQKKTPTKPREKTTKSTAHAPKAEKGDKAAYHE